MRAWPYDVSDKVAGHIDRIFTNKRGKSGVNGNHGKLTLEDMAIGRVSTQAKELLQKHNSDLLK